MNPKKARLLCVDDDPRFLLLFTTVLEAAGYSVVATNDPCNALQLVTGAAFDLVIVDYDMPHMNGAELACHIKQHKSDLPIILFSGNASLPAHALSVVDDYVVKGGALELLLHRLNDKTHTPIEGCEHHNPECSSKNEAGILNREPLQKLGLKEWTAENIMNTDELFPDSICEEETRIAERELSSFIAAVTELYGPEQARIAGKEWLDESELMDNPPLSTSRNWRAVTVAASARLARRVVAKEVQRSA